MPPSQRQRKDAKLDDLDSLLDSFSGPSVLLPENETVRLLGEEHEAGSHRINGGGEEEEGGHMVDTVDPHAVDFTPLFQSHLGTAINYHDESHLNTEHHRKLQQHNPNSRRGSRASSPTDLNKTIGSNSSNSSSNGFRQTPALLSSHLHHCCSQTRLFLLRRIRQRSNNNTNHKEDSDPCKYIVVGMLLFIFFSVYRQMNGSPPAYHMPSSSVAKEKRTTKTTTTINGQEIRHAPPETEIPLDVDMAYMDVTEPIGIMDTPIYWHIPRSGGTTMKLIMSMCMGRSVACEQGAGHQLDEQLELLQKPFGNFANVDTSTPLGLERAARLGLIPSRMVDVVLTPHVREATKLFDAHHRGRLFGLFRDPVERVVSLYYFLRMPDQQESIGLPIQHMSLEEFASTVSENWMVRSLTNTMTGPLHESHLHAAQEILRRKFLVGLLEDKTESLRRIEAYFGWKLPSRVSQTCKNNMFYFEPQSKNLHDPVDTDSNEYRILQSRNRFDTELYEYAKALFQEQKALVG